jgi:hypothetical protein
MGKWQEIQNKYYDVTEGCIKIDAWKTTNDSEEGKVIAKVFEDKRKGTVYFDMDAKTDIYAQKAITEAAGRMYA